jgi:DnaJ domain
MQIKNHYEVLGIRKTASKEEIDLAFRGRRTQYHPDKYSNTDEITIAWATSEMQAVNQAYQLLSNATTRTDYDKKLEDSESRKNMGCGRFEKEEMEMDSKSFAVQCIEIFSNKEAIAKDLLVSFTAIPCPNVENPKSWEKRPIIPDPMPPDIHKSVGRMKIMNTGGLILLTFSAISLFIFPNIYIAGVSFISASLLIFFAKPNASVLLEKTRRHSIVEQHRINFENELSQWEEKASGNEVSTYRSQIIKSSKNFITFLTDQKQRVDHLIEKNVQNQIDEYLRQMSVRDSVIAGVGPSRKVALIQHGVKCAADVKRGNFIGREGYKIPGIGESIYNYMVEWHNSCVNEFEADLSHRKLTEKLNPVFEEYTEKTTPYDLLTTNANILLTQKINNMERERLRLKKPMENAIQAMRQAESNLAVLKTHSFGVKVIVPMLIVLGVIISKPILDHLDNSSLKSHQNSELNLPEKTFRAETTTQSNTVSKIANDKPTILDIEAKRKLLHEAKTEPSQPKAQVDLDTVKSNLIEKSEVTQKMSSTEGKQNEAMPPAILIGQWSGSMSCGAYVGTRTVNNSSPWTLPVNMDVSVNAVEWKRIGVDYSEILSGSLKADTGLTLSGEGHFNNAPNKSWKTNVEAKIISAAVPKIVGIATMFSMSGEIIRNCKVQLNLE